VRQLIEQTGASLLYPPPSSPDLNPIEKAWNKLKEGLRAARHAAQALNNAIQGLPPTLTAQNAKAWFGLPFQQL
jgi:transposase